MIRSTLSLIALILAAFSFRFFIAEPFVIPSPSMYPTLIEGDYLYVSKYNYGFSRYTFYAFGLMRKYFPNSPKLFEGRVLGKAPKRGDIAVFVGEKDGVRYVKRVIGFPGEKIEFKKGVIYIDDKPLKLERIEDFQQPTSYGITAKTPQYIETLPNGYKHKILREDPNGNLPSDNMGPYFVPEGHYFMVGDNRNSSADSRFASPFGYVSFENLLGPVQFIFFSIDSSIWDIFKAFEMPSIIRFSRFFTWTN
jgi:signal peptidase I